MAKKKDNWIWWIGGLGVVAVVGGFLLFNTGVGRQILKPFVLQYDKMISESAGIPTITELAAARGLQPY